MSVKRTGVTIGTQQLQDEARGFIEEYVRAFDSIDGSRIAKLYHAPCVTMRGDGSIHSPQSRDELTRFFQGVADSYHRDGYRSTRFKIVDVTPIGGRSALLTIDWELLRGDDTVLRSWRQSYNLVRIESEWQILASTFHISQ